MDAPRSMQLMGQERDPWKSIPAGRSNKRYKDRLQKLSHASLHYMCTLQPIWAGQGGMDRTATGTPSPLSYQA